MLLTFSTYIKTLLVGAKLFVTIVFLDVFATTTLVAQSLSCNKLLVSKSKSIHSLATRLDKSNEP